MKQQQQQNVLDAQRANALQRQQTPLMQYQALLPFIQSVPTSRTQTTTQFGRKPSALQTGLGVGLSAFGGIGNVLKPTGNQYGYSPLPTNTPPTPTGLRISPAISSTFNPNPLALSTSPAFTPSTFGNTAPASNVNLNPFNPATAVGPIFGV